MNNWFDNRTRGFCHPALYRRRKGGEAGKMRRVREENGEEREGKEEKEDKSEGKERKKDDEWEGRRGPNAEHWEVAGKLPVNGSLEKRSSRTIYILSMRQNYIIAHTRNHTAHTQDWDLRRVGWGGMEGREKQQTEETRGREIKRESGGRQRRKVTWNDLKVIDTGCSQLRNGQHVFFYHSGVWLGAWVCVSVSGRVCVPNLLEISCSGWNYLHVLLSRSNQAQKCNVHVDKTGARLQMCAHSQTYWSTAEDKHITHNTHKSTRTHASWSNYILLWIRALI